jgi:hypothetical protein
MPSTVTDVFAAAGLRPDGVIRWGDPVPDARTGVYVVALTDDPGSTDAALDDAPIYLDRLRHLLDVRRELLLDGGRPSTEELAARLRAFWLTDEAIVYVGLAGQPLRTRVRQYYTTPIGAKRPHAGGWWVKTLAVLDELWVHFAATPDYETAERKMLCAFAAGLSPGSRAALHDSERVGPFANLRTGRDEIKDHGIRGATGDLAPSPSSHRTSGGSTEAAASPPTPSHPASDGPMASPRPTPLPRSTTSGQSAARGRDASLRVTAKDLLAGQVRFARAAKRLFPPDRAYVEVVVRGHPLHGRWDSRVGADKERSGLLRLGRGKLDGLVAADEVFTLTVEADGTVHLT